MNNKQTNKKGDKMRKIAIVIGILSVLATSANAGYWTDIPYSNQSTNWTTQWHSVWTY